MKGSLQKASITGSEGSVSLAAKKSGPDRNPGRLSEEAWVSAITTAPCCWGVDDVTNPNLPSWERVFDEVAAAGYGGLELGPYGYVPLDLKRVSEALRARGLFIVAGTIFDDLVSPANREDLLRQTDEICTLVSSCRSRHRGPASATPRPT